MKTGNGKFTFLLLVLLAIHASLASLEEARTPVVNPSQYEIFLQRNGEVPEDQRRQHTAEGILDAESSEEVGGRRVLVDTGVKFGLSAPPLNSGPSMATVNMSFYRWESVTPPPVVDWRKTVAMTAIQTQFVPRLVASFPQTPSAVLKLLGDLGSRFHRHDVGDRQQQHRGDSVAAAGVRLRDEAVLPRRVARVGLLLPSHVELRLPAVSWKPSW
ncbi:unnamed protein product [Closterium sp. NIES-65]|nr:unnamed protein product [Closterium sp. NIES-65]